MGNRDGTGPPGGDGQGTGRGKGGCPPSSEQNKKDEDVIKKYLSPSPVAAKNSLVTVFKNGVVLDNHTNSLSSVFGLTTELFEEWLDYTLLNANDSEFARPHRLPQSYYKKFVIGMEKVMKFGASSKESLNGDVINRVISEMMEEDLYDNAYSVRSLRELKRRLNLI